MRIDQIASAECLDMLAEANIRPEVASAVRAEEVEDQTEANERIKTKVAETLGWGQNEPAEGRVVRVSDAYETYYAVVPALLTETDAVEGFIRTYRYNDDGTEEALRRELRHEMRKEWH